MTFKKPIYRILFFASWLVVLGGLVTLLIAANRKNKEHLCKGVEVSINNGGDKIYVQKEEVLKSLERTAKGSLIKKHFGEINLTQLERNVELSPWIRDAQLYFDTKDVLHVAVAERVPVARVFTTTGTSFYIDSTGYAMPLMESYSVKLPVVTGFTTAKKWTARDSAVLTGVKQVVGFISPHPFWNAQVGQIDITPDGKFELIPVIGSHLIKLGTAEDVEKKLNKLFVFYKQVLGKAGLAKYSALDIQFDGQVVAIKKGPQSPIDSIQLQKNIQELMRRKAVEQEAEGMLPDEALPIAIAPVITVNADSIEAAQRKKEALKNNRPIPPGSKKTTVQKSNAPPGIKKPAFEKPKEQKPKAVVGEKGENEY